MARGRKKGGLQINQLNDTDEITSMIINQINSLNKKLKAFNAQGIEEHGEYVKQLLTEDMAQFNDNGSISKSKNFYKDKNIVWLKKTLSALHKINNHAFYGTVPKYKKEMTAQLKGVKAHVEEYLRKKGYNENFIREVTNSKDFYVALFDAFKNNPSYGSNQLTEKVALNYTDSGLTDAEKNKILNNIEYSQSVKERIREEQAFIEEVRRMRNGKKR
jgi:hypothetical protein